MAENTNVPNFDAVLGIPCCVDVNNHVVSYLISPLIMVVYLLGGAIMFMYLESWGFWESLYFCVITISTVGYGDMTPTTVFKKIFTLFYLYIGIAFIASIVGAWVGIVLGKVIDEDMPDKEDADNNDATPGETPTAKEERYFRQDFGEICRALGVVGLLGCIGTIVYACNENMSTVDAVYFCMITLATVGYGDIDQKELSTKMFDVVFVLFGVPIIAISMAKFSQVAIRRYQRKWVKDLEERGVTMEMIRSIDYDKSGTIERHEFLGYILVHMGKVKAIEVNSVNELFNTLDRNHSGTLDQGDIKEILSKLQDNSVTLKTV